MTPRLPFSLFIALFFCIGSLLFCTPAEAQDGRMTLADETERSLRENLLDAWYPKATDEKHGGFLSTFTYNWKPAEPQNKMIVTQARHVWTNSMAAMRYPETDHYLKSAGHGYQFLKEVMWDQEHGGFHTLTNRKGKVISGENEEKTAYGNSFGIYGLAAYFKASGDTSALNLAKKTFQWLEEHSHDPEHGGYFQHMKRDGTIIKRDPDMPSVSDVGYKDQNSSIHLLEAFTELYSVWPDSLLRERLLEMLLLVRDTITTQKGYMNLFFQPDWTPVSFREEPEEVIHRHHYLDHVSFGHDVETAYLMLEASHVLGLKDDAKTFKAAKKMTDHALQNGWDSVAGGFYDGGYYFKGNDQLTIVKDTKNWWAQAEGLNTLLLMADHFPEDELQYYQKFEKLWEYIRTNLIDHEHGGWYEGGLDKQPKMRTALKGHIWKSSYHNYRALANVTDMLRAGGAEKQ